MVAPPDGEQILAVLLRSTICISSAPHSLHINLLRGTENSIKIILLCNSTLHFHTQVICIL